MPASLDLGQLVVHEENPAPGDQVNVSWTLHNSGDADAENTTCGITLEGPDHAPIFKHQTGAATVRKGGEQHYNHSFEAGEAGDYEVIVFSPDAGSKSVQFTVAGRSD